MLMSAFGPEHAGKLRGWLEKKRVEMDNFDTLQKADPRQLAS